MSRILDMGGKKIINSGDATSSTDVSIWNGRLLAVGMQIKILIVKIQQYITIIDGFHSDVIKL